MRLFPGLLLCLVATCLSAQEWTRFRGPNGTGVHETISVPAEWTEADYAWKLELPGIGHSSPVLWGDRLFLLSADPETATRYVLGIDSGRGEILWKKEYPSQSHPIHKKSSYASVTPAVDAEQVYVAWSTPRETFLAAFDHAGTERWKTDIGGWIGQHGYGTSPVLIGDLVVITSSQEAEKRAGGDSPRDCFVIAVNRVSGDVVWKTPRKIDTASYSVPCIRKNAAGKDELIFNSTAEGIFALDPFSGKELWSSGPVFTMRTVSSPILWKDLVYGTTGSGQGGNYIVAFSPGEMKTVFDIRKEMPYVPTPVFRDDLLFLWSDKGIVTCIHPADGKTIWQKRVTGNFSGSPVRAGDKLFCVDEDGVVVSLAATNEYQLLGRTDLKEKSHSTPALANGKMFVRTISHLYAIKGKK